MNAISSILMTIQITTVKENFKRNRLSQQIEKIEFIKSMGALMNHCKNVCFQLFAGY